MSLACEGLVVMRGGHRVVAGLSLAVAPGELVWLRGPNGSGKSTVLLALAGRAPSTGEIRVGGTDARALAPWSREERMPLLAQEPELQVECLAIDNLVDTVVLGERPWRWLTTSAARARRAAWERAEPVALRLGLDRATLWQPLGRLSVGQRRLCGLLRTLRATSDGHARVLLLDEPLAGLRADRIDAVLGLLRERLAEGWCAVVSEHVPAIGEVPGTRVLALEGRS